jgi:uncharacterized protein with HEPN domain
MEQQITLPTISVSQSQYEVLKDAACRAKMELRDFLVHQLSMVTPSTAKETASPEALRVANGIKEALKDVNEGNVYSYDNIDDALRALTH